MVDFYISKILDDTKKSRYYFLHGGCFEFAKMLQSYLGGSLRYLVVESHCVLSLDGKLFDVTGNVTNTYKFSHYLTEKELLSRRKLCYQLGVVN